MCTCGTLAAMSSALPSPLISTCEVFTVTTETKSFECSMCHEVKTHPTDSCTTGYGEIDGKKVCFACCGKLDEETMKAEGKIVLYLSEDRTNELGGIGHIVATRGKVTNWPNTLSFPCRIRKGNHNIAGSRYDIWFTGPDGKQWHGVQFGDNTQICRCRRLKTSR